MAANGASEKLQANIAQIGLRTWAVCALPVALVVHLAVFHKQALISRKWVLLPGFLAGACLLWLRAISQAVPEPYLDEVFHIPQAQKYCQGRFREWDDKITTPPGLYFFSVLLPQAASKIGLLWVYSCDAASLRVVNTVGLFVLAYLALLCRREIEARIHQVRSPALWKPFSEYALHTSFNIALFPLLFFFSGLYYTDVLSTAVVVGAFLNHLNRVGQDHSSILSDLISVALGVLSLLMRQTNVFWFVVYMGGLETVHAVKTLRPERVDQPFMTTAWAQLKFFAWRYSVGDIHDPPLNQSWPDDMLFTTISLVIAAICNPVRVLRQIWPYVTVLIAFASFVVWNGGVVLGDKSNHIATIHVAQMLYIWPFFAFFSLPLLFPYAIPAVKIFRTLLCSKKSGPRFTNTSSTEIKPSRGPRSSKRPESRKEVQATESGSRPPPGPTGSLSDVSTVLQIAEISRLLVWPTYLLGTVVLSGLIVRYNTIVHPFTLADNRHYMFYVFRYTIRRAAWIRYLLLVPYTISRWMVWGTMAGCSEWFSPEYRDECSAHYHALRRAPFTNYPFWIAYGSKKRQTSAEYPEDISQALTEQTAAANRELSRSLSGDPLKYSTEPGATSTGLIFLLTTTLSLVTAPLVEPRYFIIPWVMWRLQVPAWRLHDHSTVGRLFEGISRDSYLGSVVGFFRHRDLRLFLETAWLVAINLVTCYVFLEKPYIWKAEDGTVLDDGRLQRFMW
ncbi:Dol-P-Glc:Glc(2)Man(9)GlcNAc(2)-PP-Dol alpha-1,2-glucosyltransferase [Tolypocladium ophioglossoides CBS 100239]|uniref:Dol-P-Glc:Glc(2)Man(9)GlcNAc(2)-PP-Dol alpha-1,2-glucosyltransferase n=1 Tax=Tolypocladium ophioglossoides (strain CBS 100239) TaxID=1163406 RepID=A0A0L0NCG0_TOLOC|nr:Dol-P-Glc:Glc(2)Man(9)GlcNAc(2)-PP-Dol alpha-1,2-glucosyltransferase [Tolypocladium ophioglossoides CBS 100239]